MPVHYFSQDIRFTLKNKPRVTKWLLTVIRSHRKKAGEINFIFSSDEHLFNLNKQYLKHKSYTDIITFEYSTDKELLSDIFISVERVKENAKKFKTTFESELHRVMVHGVLHLLGYKDKKPAEKKKMRTAEEKFLKQLP